MRHDFTLRIFIVACLFGLLLVACKSKKHITTDIDTQTGTVRIERVVDTTRTVETATERSDVSGSEVEQSYTRTTEYDTSGVVRRVQEEWRDRQRADVALRDKLQETVSVTGRDALIEVRDSSRTVSNEEKRSDVDTRPVQGIEWLWVIIGLVVVLGIVGLIIYRRLKLKKL